MAGDAALDLLIDERLTPFSRRILPSVSLTHPHTWLRLRPAHGTACHCTYSSARDIHLYSLDIMVWAEQGGTKAPLAPLPAGLKTKEGIALLLREEPALRKDIFNAYVAPPHLSVKPRQILPPDDAHHLTPFHVLSILRSFSTVFQPVRRRVSAQPAAGRAVCKTGGGATIIRRYMAFEQLHTALLTYDVVPKLMPIAQAFELFIQVRLQSHQNMDMDWYTESEGRASTTV